MLNDVEVAKYFLSKDTEHKLFANDLVYKNNRNFYAGNARLNKYLHLAQNIFIAKTGRPLMEATFYAYDNGAVSLPVQQNYISLLNNCASNSGYLTNEERNFLDTFYRAFKNAELDELIALSHEDNEWKSKCNYYSQEDQKMDYSNRVEEYRTQYADIVKILDRM